jgi:hypothetical protein
MKHFTAGIGHILGYCALKEPYVSMYFKFDLPTKTCQNMHLLYVLQTAVIIWIHNVDYLWYVYGAKPTTYITTWLLSQIFTRVRANKWQTPYLGIKQNK